MRDDMDLEMCNKTHDRQVLCVYVLISSTRVALERKVCD
jgi:hypothetical protein